MKNFTSCICILGLSGVAFGDVVMDQIGPDDGSGIGTNITGCQDFEAAYDVYDIATLDNFTGAGEVISMVEMVLNGWNGFVDPSGVTGYTSNLHSTPTAASLDLTGDVASSFADAADATTSATWLGAGFNVMMPADMAAASGDNWVSMIPANAFGTNGQTGTADALVGDGVLGWQANPGGGFGMPGNMQEMTNEAAYRMHSAGDADPCNYDLGFCPADIDDSGAVDVDDILAIIGTFGQTGDGTYRPAGDIFPLPNGDCAVTVDDILALIGAFGDECLVEGGCCLGDGSCSVSSSTDCAAAGGTYFGDFTTCADGSCVAAACCIDASTCADLTEGACNALGGTYKGDGTACATTDCAAVEAGDECANSIAVYDGANAFDTSMMTPSQPQPDETACTGPFPMDWLNSVDGWYSYVATGGMTTFNTCDVASFDTSMVLYDGTCENQVACNGDSDDDTGCQTYHSTITYDCVEGSTYYIRIGEWNGGVGGAGTLNIEGPPTGNGACCMTDGSCLDGLNAADCIAFGGSFAGDATTCADDPDPCAAGAGDECATAVAIFEGANAFDTSMMTASYPVPDESQCEGTYLAWGDSPDGWYAWTATGNGTASFSACDEASYDTSMALYSDCDTQIACSGDITGEDGCQAYYSAVYDVPVTQGEVYIVRMGGYNAATGPGTITVTFTGADVIGACCMTDGSCMDAVSDDCAAFGGAWSSSSLCADANCPQPWTGCAADSTPECDACWNDGDDSTTDCNGGNNAPTPVFQDLALGVQYCGTMAVFVDGPTGGTYRDLDWYTNAAINAGGDFTMSFGTSGMGAFAYIYDAVAGTVLLGVDVPEGGGVVTVSGNVPAGDYVVLTGPNDWNVAWTCASGLAEYTLQID